jgi:crotonobetainyl-CoA:carnitine CoA-transferase CaiB-like acyl-CoA transferase
VLAVEQYGAGPFGTQALADLGAEVVKIENAREGGDVSRSLGPYFEPALGETASSLFFQAFNRNKLSVGLDLTTPEGQRVFRALVRKSDAIACNLRGDVPAKLGITYDSLADIRPEIVCCFLSAYGRTGSRAKWPGYDYMIQAETGYFSINGDPESPPSRFGLSIVDFMTGYAMALSLVAGVLDARATGKGRDIDVSLYDVGMANLNYLAAFAGNAGHTPGRMPRSGHPTLVPCQLFRTADGWIYIMANKEKFFPALCRELGRPELADDPRFRTFADRLKHRAELSDLLDAAFSAKPTAEWIGLLAGKVPAAPVASVKDAMGSAFTAERGMMVDIADDAGASVSVVGSPFRTGDRADLRAGPPLGRDTDALLREAGFGADEIAGLRAGGIVV